MIICGIKLTHDGTIALINNSKLEFSYEMEKFNNKDRHSKLQFKPIEIEALLKQHGYNIRDIDTMVFDGWHQELHHPFINEGMHLKLSGYGSRNNLDLLSNTEFTTESFPQRCKSYHHIAGHVIGAYCSSPFAEKCEDSFLLAWDGGMFPQLFYFNSHTNHITNEGELFTLTCGIYNRLGLLFNEVFPDDYMSVPGKMMAFAALGVANDDLRAVFIDLMKSFANFSRATSLATLEENDAEFISQLKITKLLSIYSVPDIIATFQQAIEHMILDSLRRICDRLKDRKMNLCYSGGAALNITWNTAIRNSGLFESVWIPPFANDTGSAIGTACCEMLKNTPDKALKWNVYSGQRLNDFTECSGWEKRRCTIESLARLLYKYQEPVVFLNDAAELGPRALGNRSILAPATDMAMKHLLNTIKEREYYRPVAPICLEEDSAEFFSPGTADPYMLYTHQVKSNFKDKIPAVCHNDGTARLQTINQAQNPAIYKLLNEYKQLSGVALLCNTSANNKGKGFFPDVASAMKWGKTNLVWSEGYLYLKKGFHTYFYKQPV